LRCEVRTLGYPRAALFAFCTALLLQNTFAMLHGSLRAVHGAQAVDERVSAVLLSQELRKTYDGLMVQVPAEHWREVGRLSLKRFARLLRRWTERIDLGSYRKSPRGPKKLPPKKSLYRNGHHLATAKLLALRKQPP